MIKILFLTIIVAVILFFLPFLFKELLQQKKVLATIRFVAHTLICAVGAYICLLYVNSF